MAPIIRQREMTAEKAKEEIKRKEAEKEEARRMQEAALRAKALAEEGRKQAEAKRLEQERIEKEKEERERKERERIEFHEQKKRLKREHDRREAAKKMQPKEALKLIYSSNTQLQAHRVITTLKTLLGNICNDPGEKIYRRIRQANKHIQTELLQYRGGEEFLLAVGFRLRRIKVQDEQPNPKEVLRENLLKFYKTFAPDELPKVNIPRVVEYFAGGKEADLWDRLRKKYGKSKEDLPANFDNDHNGQPFYVLDEPSVNSKDQWQRWFQGIKQARAIL